MRPLLVHSALATKLLRQVLETFQTHHLRQQPLLEALLRRLQRAPRTVDVLQVNRNDEERLTNEFVKVRKRQNVRLRLCSFPQMANTPADSTNATSSATC